MTISFSEIHTSVMEGRVLVDIKSKDGNLLLVKNGQALEALEYIVSLILNRNAETRVKILLDIEGFRSNQEKKLQVLANDAAKQVKASGRTFSFDPMPARDRRIIHLALKADEVLETLSEGDGMFRRVVVKLK